MCETKRKQELESQEEGEKRRSGPWEERENAVSRLQEEQGRQPGRVKGGGRSRRDEEEEGREGKVELRKCHHEASWVSLQKQNWWPGEILTWQDPCVCALDEHQSTVSC